MQQGKSRLNTISKQITTRSAGIGNLLSCIRRRSVCKSVCMSVCLSISTVESPSLLVSIYKPQLQLLWYISTTATATATTISPMSSFEIHHVLRDIGPGSKNETSTVASLHHLYALVSGVSITKLLPAVAVLYICGVASLALYRLYFHPISQFPGPRIAAVTGWYQAYYDIWKGGKMTQNIALLHEKYGEFRMRRAGT